MSRILVAVPAYENIYPETFKSIYDLDPGRHDVEFSYFRGYDVANARNQIARYMLDNDFDYVLQLDNDEILPEKGLLQLLETEQATCFDGIHNVVVGYTLQRSRKHDNRIRTTAFKAAQHYSVDSAYTVDEIQTMLDKGMQNIIIRGSGLGHSLIHRSIYENMKFPYYKWIEYQDGQQLSEDLFFCEKIKSLKLKSQIILDLRVRCGHVMRITRL